MARDLHNELIARIDPSSEQNAAHQYSASYRPIERGGRPSLDVWHRPLALGEPLPTMPLMLRGGLCLPANLAVTYERTCREQRLDRAISPSP